MYSTYTQLPSAAFGNQLQAPPVFQVNTIIGCEVQLQLTYCYNVCSSYIQR